VPTSPASIPDVGQKVVLRICASLFRFSLAAGALTAFVGSVAAENWPTRIHSVARGQLREGYEGAPDEIKFRAI
jgi:hypothetical protein